MSTPGLRPTTSCRRHIRMKFELCKRLSSGPNLEVAAVLHASTISRLRIHSLRNPKRHNKVTQGALVCGAAWCAVVESRERGASTSMMDDPVDPH
eukprot:1154832-Pelagomonas_calceolata.AAC.6